MWNLSERTSLKALVRTEGSEEEEEEEEGDDDEKVECDFFFFVECFLLP